MKDAPHSRSEDRSAAILQAAFDEFTQEGYAASRMENIASRAGVTKGLIYFYYKNKQELFEAVFRQCIQEPIRGAFLNVDPARSMASHLARALGKLYADFVSEPFFAQVARLILMENHRFPELHAYYYREIIQPTMEIVRGFLEEGVRRGEWKAEAVPEFLQVLVAPSIMFVLWRSAMNGYQSLDAERYCRDHQRLLLRSLGLDEQAVDRALEEAGRPGISRDVPPEPPTARPAGEEKKRPLIRRIVRHRRPGTGKKEKR